MSEDTGVLETPEMAELLAITEATEIAVRAHGIDVSVWQDDNSTPQQIDFARAKRNGAQFAGIKVSQGIWADPDYLYNWAAAKAERMPRIGYHYLDWDPAPDLQAQAFAALLRTDLPEIAPVADYEKRTGAPTRATAIKKLRAFVDAAEAALNRELMIYTSIGFWREFGGDAEFFKTRRLWLAAYTDEGYVNDNLAGLPWECWTYWQYSDKGDGLAYGAESKQIDVNWYNGSVEQMYQEFAIPWAIEPEEPEEPPEGLTLKALRTVNVRKAPHTGAAVLGKLYAGDTVQVSNVSGSDVWVYDERLGGYVAMQYKGVTYLAKEH